MRRSGSKKPALAGKYTQYLDDLRSLLHAIDPQFFSEDDGSLIVAMDVYETEQDFIIEFDLPGLEPKNINLVQRGMACTLQVEKLSDTPVEQVSYICIERHFGRLRRSFRLPDFIDPNLIEAEYQRGVLRIICPKSKERIIFIKELSSE